MLTVCGLCVCHSSNGATSPSSRKRKTLSSDSQEMAVADEIGTFENENDGNDTYDNPLKDEGRGKDKGPDGIAKDSSAEV